MSCDIESFFASRLRKLARDTSIAPVTREEYVAAVNERVKSRASWAAVAPTNGHNKNENKSGVSAASVTF